MLIDSKKIHAKNVNYQIFPKLNDQCNFGPMKCFLSHHLESFDLGFERACVFPHKTRIFASVL